MPTPIAKTFSFDLTDANGTSHIVLGTDGTVADTSGYGPSYSISSASGTVDGVAITGEVGTGGSQQTIGTEQVDNAIFTTAAGGLQGSTSGIDNNGFAVAAGGVDYNFYTTGGTFNIYDGNAALTTQPVTLANATQSFTYNLVDSNGLASQVVVTAALTAADTSGFGPSYSVSAITGNLGGVAISGEVGTGGTEQTSASGQIAFVNAIFAAYPSGYNQAGNVDGIDYDGLEFNAGGVEYNLAEVNGVLTLVTAADGVLVTNLSVVSTDAPCYLAGTRIAVADGEAAVEALAVGDLVRTLSGALRPIVWIGRRSYTGRFLARNPKAMPVRFTAGSLGDGLPQRDLLVSADHAIFLAGVLVPAQCLVNGSSIVVDRSISQVDYYHVELEQHDILLAEGAPAESFVDDDSRSLFQNAGERAGTALAAERGVYCARRVESGPVLEAIRASLAAAAGVALAA